MFFDPTVYNAQTHRTISTLCFSVRVRILCRMDVLRRLLLRKNGTENFRS